MAQVQMNLLCKRKGGEVEIFRTNVFSHKDASSAINILNSCFPQYSVNFDLSDKDKILRVEGKIVATENIVDQLNEMGFECELIKD
jgi:glutathione peroxidase-family protein